MSALENMGVPKQICFVVPDLQKAAEHYHRAFGIGPFLSINDSTCPGHLYRNAPSNMNIDCLFAQWGDIQLELVQLKNDEPCIFREPVGSSPTQPRLHHLCYHPENLAETIAQFERSGTALAFDYTMPTGKRAVIMDTIAELGYFVELYEYTPDMRKAYDKVREASHNFDGTDLVRPWSSRRSAPPA